MKYGILALAALLFAEGSSQAQYFNRFGYPGFRGYYPYNQQGILLSNGTVQPLNPNSTWGVPVVISNGVVSPLNPNPNPVPVAPTVSQFVPTGQQQFAVNPFPQAAAQMTQQQATQTATNWYTQFLNRKPDVAQVQKTVTTMTKQGENVALAEILGGNEFWLICGQDRTKWLNSLFVGILNRQPQDAEIQQLSQMLIITNGDRQRVALNFLSTRNQVRR